MCSTSICRIQVALLLTALIATACDSNEEATTTDTEMLIGKWAIMGFVDDTGDRTDIIVEGFEGLHLEFSEGGLGTLELFDRHGPARILATRFAIDEERDFIEITVDASGDTPMNLDFAYSITSEVGTATFYTTQTDALNAILGSNLTGDVQVAASKFGEEGIVH